MSPLAGWEGAAGQTRSRFVAGRRWGAGRAEEEVEEEEQVRFDWQNQRRAVPKMKATPAGIPMMTGHGRLGDVAVGTALFCGFRSVKTRGIKKCMNDGRDNRISCVDFDS